MKQNQREHGGSQSVVQECRHIFLSEVFNKINISGEAIVKKVLLILNWSKSGLPEGENVSVKGGKKTINRGAGEGGE